LAARYVQIALHLSTTDTTISPLITKFEWAADVPDKVVQGTDVNIGIGGTTIPFNLTYNVIPNVQVTIINGDVGDTVVLSSPTLTDMFIEIKNGASSVSRNINYVVQGH